MPTLSIYFLLELDTSKTFFQHVINEWNKLNSTMSYNIPDNALLNFITPVERKIFNINDLLGVKILKTEIRCMSPS